MQKWEYLEAGFTKGKENWHISSVNNQKMDDWANNETDLDFIIKAGREGWELVTTNFAPVFDSHGDVQSSYYFMFFKRPIE